MAQETPVSLRIKFLLEKSAGDPIAQIVDEVNQAPYPATAEPALVHPFNNSVVKLRNNGMIDVFVDGNTGIRIDPDTQTVNLISGGTKFLSDYMKGWINGDVNWEVARNWTMNLGGDFNVTANNINLTAKNKMTLKGAPIHLNPKE